MEYSIEEFEAIVQARADRDGYDAGGDESEFDVEQDDEILRLVESFLATHPVSK